MTENIYFILEISLHLLQQKVVSPRKCPSSLTMKEMQLKTNLKLHLNLVKVNKINKKKIIFTVNAGEVLEEHESLFIV